jgi:molybdopterin synthase catalytic subunit
MNECIINGPIKPEVITRLINEVNVLKDCGGHDIFLGQVREDKREGKRVVAIEYSAYEQMVRVEAEKIRNEILREFIEVRSVVIIHSEGVVKAGELSLFVLVSAGHRNQAISACRETVEKVKSRLPVWKKEIFSDGSWRWKEKESSD